MKRIAQLLSLLFLLSLFVFVVQNLNEVDLRFATWEWRMTLAAPVVAAYVLGALSGRSIWRLFSGLRKQRKIERKVHKQAEAALKEKQLRELQQQSPPPQQ